MIAASAGNHALALAYHGKDLGIPVTVVMPIIAPIMKVSLCRQYGANVIVHGADINEVCFSKTFSCFDGILASFKSEPLWYDWVWVIS